MQQVRSRRLGSAPLTAALVLLSTWGCSKSEKPAEADASFASPTTLIDAGPVPEAHAGVAPDAGPPLAFLGTVRGTVKLKAKAKLPLAPAIANDDGTKPISTPPCPTVDLYDRRTIQQSETNGGLSPVHIALTGMSAVPSREPKVLELFIDGCRLRPTLLGAMRGDTVRLSNRSEVALLPSLPGDKFMQTMTAGESREFVVKRLGPTSVSCTFSNYCGQSSIITLSHPLYDITDAEGSFTIEQVPLDQKLTLHAWHPLFDVASVEFELSASERDKRFDLELVPSPSKPETKPAPAKKPPAPAKKPPASTNKPAP